MSRKRGERITDVAFGHKVLIKERKQKKHFLHRVYLSTQDLKTTCLMY
jgi:hypothetical protein